MSRRSIEPSLANLRRNGGETAAPDPDEAELVVVTDLAGQYPELATFVIRIFQFVRQSGLCRQYSIVVNP